MQIIFDFCSIVSNTFKSESDEIFEKQGFRWKHVDDVGSKRIHWLDDEYIFYFINDDQAINRVNRDGKEISWVWLFEACWKWLICTKYKIIYNVHISKFQIKFVSDHKPGKNAHLWISLLSCSGFVLIIHSFVRKTKIDNILYLKFLFSFS